MKRLVFVSFFIFCITLNGVCQSCTVANPNLNILYANWSNVIDVIVEGEYCNKITVTTDNGRIAPTEEECRYEIAPENLGIATIVISNRLTKEELCSIPYRVVKIPDPAGKVAGRTSGNIAKSLLIEQIGIVAEREEFGAPLVITGFTMSLFRNDSVIFSKRYEERIFNHEIKDVFAKALIGDKVLFSSIGYKLPDSRIAMLNPIELTIE